MKDKDTKNNCKKPECATTVLGVAKDKSYWDAETEVKIKDDVRKTRVRVFSISALFQRMQQLNT